LYNREKDYNAAVDLLNKCLPQAKDNNDKHTILKNLGWARMGQGQGHLDEAKYNLEKAIQLNKREAVPYCLLAQVLEGKSDKKGALVQWELCDSYAYQPKFQEEDALFHLAKQRLNTQGSEK
jgi:tetratricopeptide (TPR) repeat protein